jgi:hypothetical protein
MKIDVQIRISFSICQGEFGTNNKSAVIENFQKSWNKNSIKGTWQ